MKLDNKGWGLSTLLICFFIILFFLIISVYYAHTFSTKIDNEQNESEELNNNYYKELESNINFIVNDYINSGKIVVNNGSTTLLGLSELKQLGFTENIIDEVTKNECSGYVIIKNINNVMDINSYLKCDNYITEGYNG